MTELDNSYSAEELGQLLKEMAGSKGDWEDGTCFTGRIDDAKVAEWVKSLK